ncbi:MAG: hypothetical protein EPN97_07050 [Alphaproteobacteria bacterium]|nr:MAG: hypothetical protein EPN97_07050 [Alphaproteobacteria bacterium]
MKELGKARVFSRDRENDLLIEALAPVEGSDEFRAIAFRESRIDYLFAFDETLSGIALKNGVTIPVALPFASLKQKIYGNDFDTGGSIDLTLVTGKPVKQEQELRLSKKFNPAADNAPPPDEKPLEIIVFAHGKPTDREFKRLRLREDQISHYEQHTDRKDSETFIALKPGQTADGWSRFYVATPLHYFTYYLTYAKKEGQTVLDLSEATRPKDTSALRMD